MPPAAKPPTTKRDESVDLASRLASADLEPLRFAEVLKWVFQPACLSCHNPENKAGGVDLSSHATALSTDNVIWIQPFLPQESPLLETLTTVNGWRQMPPEGHPEINELQVQTVRKWIEQGALSDAPSADLPKSEPLSVAQKIRAHLSSERETTYQQVRDWVFEPGRCLQCHALGGRLMDLSAIRFGADMTDYSSLGYLNGIVPGELDDQRVTSAEGEVRLVEGSQIYLSVLGEAPSMPPQQDGYSALMPEQIQLLREWILRGAPRKASEPLPYAGPR